MNFEMPASCSESVNDYFEIPASCSKLVVPNLWSANHKWLSNHFQVVHSCLIDGVSSTVY